MAFRFLIDGYNLVHALGFLAPADGKAALANSRASLLAYLAHHLGDAAPAATVIFDAAHAARRSQPVQTVRGITVRFAVDQQAADDEIELMLAQTADARDVVVVSNDHRLQEAARRRKARAWTCGQFLDHLDRPVDTRAGARREENAERRLLSDAERQHWLETFKDVAEDREFRELFDRYRFDDEMKD
jgi:predicted RNA-binding protein with PIN domain